MVSIGLTKDGLSMCIVSPCGVCCLLLFGKLIHGRCAGVKMVPSRNFTCRKCEGNIEEAVKQEDTLCDEVETVSEFIYLGDRVCAGER